MHDVSLGINCCFPSVHLRLAGSFRVCLQGKLNDAYKSRAAFQFVYVKSYVFIPHSAS